MAALQQEFLARRSAGNAADKDIDFRPELADRARQFLLSDHPSTEAELKAQDGRVKSDGVIDFVLAVDPEQIEADSGPERIQEMVQAVTGGESTSGTDLLWDTLVQAEHLAAGFCVAQVSQDSSVSAGQDAAQIIYVGVALQPTGSGELWRPGDKNALVEALKESLRSMRAGENEDAAELAFAEDLTAEALAHLDATASMGPEELSSQDGIADADGIVRYVSEIHLDSLVENTNYQLILLQALVDAVAGASPHTGGPGKDLLWDTLIRAEQAEAGVAVSDIIPEMAAQDGDVSSVLHVAIALRPDAEGGLWTVRDPHALAEPLAARVEQWKAEYKDQKRTVGIRSDMPLPSASGWTPERLKAQDGQADEDGVARFTFPLKLEKLAASGNCNLIPLGDALDAVLGSTEKAHLVTDGTKVFWHRLRVAESVELNVSGTDITDLPGGADSATDAVVYLQVAAKPVMTAEFWDENNKGALQDVVCAEIEAQCPGGKAAAAQVGTAKAHASGTVNLKVFGPEGMWTMIPVEKIAGKLLEAAALAKSALQLDSQGNMQILWEELIPVGTKQVGVLIETDPSPGAAISPTVSVTLTLEQQG